MTTYSVLAADGDALTRGLPSPERCDEARQTAQRMANARGESVWLVEDVEGAEGEEFAPTTEGGAS